MSDLHDRLAFFLATDALKELSRANWVGNGARTACPAVSIPTLPEDRVRQLS